ncbi:hypothetical protein [Streptomyces chartreusis]|uniref:hypothetical protein n=1 Tax=Streptomyces chartreusis TaxID=1969 RepID=UPI0033BD13C3
MTITGTTGSNDARKDLDWTLTHGAAMSWYYAHMVEPVMVDVDGAHAAADWPLCVEASSAFLQVAVLCEQRGEGFAHPVGEAERQLRIATHGSPTADALRTLPHAHGADRDRAERARAAAHEADSRLRGGLPFLIPDLRGPGGYMRAARLSASLLRLRQAHGFDGTPDWNPTAGHDAEHLFD